MREKFSVLNHQVDARNIHVDNAARAHIEMSNFAISHLPFGQSNERAAGMDQRIGIFAQHAVIRRLARERDGVGLGFGAVSPAVEDDEDERFRTGHRIGSWLLAISSAFGE